MLVLFFRLPSALLARADGNRSDPHLTHAAPAETSTMHLGNEGEK